MSLELVAKQVKDAIKVLPLLVKVQEALDEALIASSAATAAEKRLSAAAAAIVIAQEDQRSILSGSDRIKSEADKLLADAKQSATNTLSDAQAKVAIMLSKATDKAAAVAKETEAAQGSFLAQKSANDETLAGLKAQIANGEAKLSEIRAVIAKLTGI